MKDSHPIQRIGVLTGGGDAPGLNAVIRAVVKTAVGEYGWEVLGIEDGFEGLILPDRVRPLGYDEVRGILPRGGTILGTTNRANPFDYVVEKNGSQKHLDVSDEVVRRVRDSGIDALVVIGGDGSLRIANEFSQKGLKLVGVPKTIDNDIRETRVTFGFDTAVNTAMEAIDRLHTTAESHHRVLIIEVMGRDTGWIALEAGLAGGADVILIPEIPYRLDEISGKIRARRERGAKFSLVVIAEGAVPEGGQAVYQNKDNPGGMPRLGGVAEVLADQLKGQSEAEVRTMVLGYLQRGGSPTAFDRLLASRFGNAAVHMIAEGKFGQMVALKGDDIVPVPLAKAAERQKFVPLDSDLIRTAFGLGVSLGSTPQAIEQLKEEQSTTNLH